MNSSQSSSVAAQPLITLHTCKCRVGQGTCHADKKVPFHASSSNQQPKVINCPELSQQRTTSVSFIGQHHFLQTYAMQYLKCSSTARLFTVPSILLLCFYAKHYCGIMRCKQPCPHRTEMLVFPCNVSLPKQYYSIQNS